MTEIFLAGVGMTQFGPQPHLSVKELTHAAVTEALADAGAELRDVGVAFFATTTQGPLEGQFMISGEIALRSMGLDGIPMINVENACASGSTALHMAIAYLKAGLADVALAAGAEKMVIDDRAKVLEVFHGGWDVHDEGETMRRLLAMGEGIDGPEGTGHRAVTMDVYAAWTRGHMKTYGTTQRQLAAVAAKNHFHSTMNPKCHYRKNMTVEEVLAGRALAYPLTVPMCAPLSDGAAAVVVCTREGLKRLRAERPAKVYASILVTGIERDPLDWSQHIGRRGALAAYEQAGLDPEDMSLAELHDATAFGEIVHTENLGFCALGDGGALAESGATRLGGRIPVNPSGGLESKGHPIGATGLAQVYELTLQLRGQAGARQVADARFAIAENGGGIYGIEEASCVITILGKG
jgi:acetyl-CoA acetyltransferase